MKKLLAVHWNSILFVVGFVLLRLGYEQSVASVMVLGTAAVAVLFVTSVVGIFKS